MPKLLLPKIIKDNCLDFELPDDKLIWELNFPVQKMSMSKLDWQFEIPF